MLIEVVKKFEDTIKKDTLTEKVVYGEEREYVETVINGENLNISVEKI
jgi:isoleucyl-tRNA synthetase